MPLRKPPERGLKFFVCALMLLLTGVVTSRFDSPTSFQQSEATSAVFADDNLDIETLPCFVSEIDLKPVVLSYHEAKVGAFKAYVSTRHSRRHGSRGHRNQIFVSFAGLCRPHFLSVRNDLCVSSSQAVLRRNVLFPRFGRAPPVSIAQDSKGLPEK